MDRALEVKLDVTDTRATDVRCFNPGYTFVDKVQTICRHFRQHRADPGDHAPRSFLRHYYDLFRLLEVERVLKFLGTDAYLDYREAKIRGSDFMEFTAREALALPDSGKCELFEREFGFLESLFTGAKPPFRQIIQRIREFADQF